MQPFSLIRNVQKENLYLYHLKDALAVSSDLPSFHNL